MGFSIKKDQDLLTLGITPVRRILRLNVIHGIVAHLG
jgi:hypothetical protein